MSTLINSTRVRPHPMLGLGYTFFPLKHLCVYVPLRDTSNLTTTVFGSLVVLDLIPDLV